MPVPPAELTAEFWVAGPDEALAAAPDAVLRTLDAVVRATLDAGANRLDVRLEAPAESR